MTQDSRSFTLVTLAAAAALTLGLTGCAPEISDAAGQTGKGEETINPETEWGGRELSEEQPETTLPESFPIDRFAVPDGAVIENTGETSESSWFIVFRAPHLAAADELWFALIESNQLVATEEDTNEVDGYVATLEGAGLSIFAMTIPHEDGTVQLTYELQSWS
jgi:hypothetical protein